MSELQHRAECTEPDVATFLVEGREPVYFCRTCGASVRPRARRRRPRWSLWRW